jgi:hypothetical protein
MQDVMKMVSSQMALFDQFHKKIYHFSCFKKKTLFQTLIQNLKLNPNKTLKLNPNPNPKIKTLIQI